MQVHERQTLQMDAGIPLAVVLSPRPGPVLLGAAAPGAERNRGRARIMLIPGFPREGFDRAVNPVPGRASDHGAFSGPSVEHMVNRRSTSTAARI